MYAYIDGDDIGLKIENSFMNNDEQNLSLTNNKVKEIVDKITIYLLEDKYEIVFSGADGIICKRDTVDVKRILAFIRDKTDDITFSIGAGNSLRETYLALRYAKSNGKNIGVLFIKDFKLIQ